MKRFVVPMVLGALAVAAVSTRAEAQYFFVGGGVTMPQGEFNDYAKNGYNIQTGFGVDIGKKGAWLEGEFFYGSNKHETAGQKTNLLAGFGALGYSFTPTKKVSPYVLAGAGFLSHGYRDENNSADNETESKFAWTGAAGISFTLSTKAKFWVEGRYIHSDGSGFVPINAGFTINLKGN